MSDLYAKVNDHYSSLARENTAANEEHIRKVALSFGYNPADLSSIPDGANLGVSCGNPLAIAGLKEVSLWPLLLSYSLKPFPLSLPCSFPPVYGTSLSSLLSVDSPAIYGQQTTPI